MKPYRDIRLDIAGGGLLCAAPFPDGIPQMHAYRTHTCGALRASDMPKMEVIFVEEPEPEGPFGAKGVGENCAGDRFSCGKGLYCVGFGGGSAVCSPNCADDNACTSLAKALGTDAYCATNPGDTTLALERCGVARATRWRLRAV